jgi:hypothetical protein
MPISKFAVHIAHALADYLSEDNTALLPVGYIYGRDNSAVLNPYTAGNISQKAIGFAASAVTGAMKYSFGFWSAPAGSPSPLSYNTPAVSSLLSVPGVDGVDRAIQMAQHFGLLADLARGVSLVERLQLSETDRRSDIIGDHGFKAVNPDNLYQNLIIQEDCHRILAFLTHKDNWHEKTSGKRIIKAIQTFFNIRPEHIEHEKRTLLNSFVEIPVPKDQEEDFEIIGEVQSTMTPSSAPQEFLRPENALLKLIYEKALVLKAKLADEIIISVARPNNSNGTGVSRQYSSGSPQDTSEQRASTTQQSNGASSSSSRSNKSNSNRSTQFPLS